MIIPDVNLLLHSYDSRSPFHAKAVSGLEACLSGKESLAFLHVVILGFVRLATSRWVFQNPMNVSEAGGVVRTWLKQRMARVVAPGPAHAESVLSLLESVGAAGNLATGAQIAAIAMENRAVLHTADTDFLMFAGLHWFNPITGTKSGSLRPGRVLRRAVSVLELGPKRPSPATCERGNGRDSSELGGHEAR